MKGQVKRLVAAGMIYTIGVVTVAIASYVLEHRRIIEDIDARLYAAASNLPALLPADFHDRAVLLTLFLKVKTKRIWIFSPVMLAPEI